MSDLSTPPAVVGPRPVRAPRGTSLSCRNWLIEAAYRMIQNNLDPEVAENPDALVVYGGIGKAARNRVPPSPRSREPRPGGVVLIIVAAEGTLGFVPRR